MTSQRDALLQRIERAQHSVEQLPAAAASLNSATDQLGKSVAELDAVLKRFSLGVPTWVPFASGGFDPYYWAEEIGYAKVGGKWGIAIRTVEGDYQAPDEEEVEQWLFNDAPRLLRVQAVERIPDLLEGLLKRAAEMTKTISEKAQEVDALTSVINSVIDPPSKQETAKRQGKTGR